MVSSHDGTTLKVNAKGRVEFTDDDADVKSLSAGGYFTIEKSTGGWLSSDSQRFEARSLNGAIVRKYFRNGKALDETAGRAWLKTFLPELLREMAVNADQRVARTLAHGGPGAVLDLVTQTHSGFAKAAYLRELYKQASLDRATLARSLQQAGREIASDYDLAEALRAAADTQAIDGAMPEFVGASRSIHSDYDLRRVLTVAVSRPLSQETTAAVLQGAVPTPDGAGIDSDYDMAELLIAASPALPQRAPAAWAQAVQTIGSTYDRRRAISAVLTPSAPAGVVDAALGAAAGVKGDYDLATLLVDAAKAGVLTDRTAAAYLDAAGHVGGGYDRRRVLEAVAQTSVGDQSLAGAVRLAASTSSDYDRAESLIALSHASGLGLQSRKALVDAAMTMHGDYDRGRVLNALAKAGVMGSN
jgi:hypothetical protein